MSDEEKFMLVSELGPLRDTLRTIQSEIDNGKEADGQFPKSYAEDRGRRMTLKLARAKVHHVQFKLHQIINQIDPIKTDKFDIY